MRFAFQPKHRGTISEKNLLLAMKHGSSTIICTDDGHDSYREIVANGGKSESTPEEGSVVDSVGLEGSHPLRAFVIRSDHQFGQVL